MSDAITAALGAVLMIIFVSLIAAKLAQVALWIVCLIGIACMLWAVWTDGLAPVFGRTNNGK
jgi:hypothetical protein